MEKHLKTWGQIMPQLEAWIAEENEEMQKSASKEYEELIALQDARIKDAWAPPTIILMNTWTMNWIVKNHHEEFW